MLLDGEFEIKTSFGPLGRSKVIRNQVAGSLLVTRDGRQLLESYLSDPSRQDPLEDVLIKMCCSVAVDYGDGSMSAFVIMSLLLKHLTTSGLAQHRFLFLNALELVIHAVDVHKEHITKHMVDKSVWHASSETDDNADFFDHIRGLWGCILYPATNSATAASIGSLLVSVTLVHSCHWLVNGH